MKFKRLAALLMASVMTAGAASVMSASASEVAVRALKGDINGDTDIDILDYIAVINHVNGVKAIGSAQLARADVNWDGKVDIFDAQLISWDINGIRSIRSGNVLGRTYVTNEDLEAIMDHINGVKALTGAKKTRADLNRDGRIDIEDASLLSTYLYVR